MLPRRPLTHIQTGPVSSCNSSIWLFKVAQLSLSLVQADRHHTSSSTLAAQHNGLSQPHCTEHLNGSDDEAHNSLPHTSGHDSGECSTPLTLFPLTRAPLGRLNALHGEASSQDEGTSLQLGMSLPELAHSGSSKEVGAGEGEPLLRVVVESASGRPQCSSCCDRCGGERGEGGAWEGGDGGRGPVHVWVRGVWHMFSRWRRNVQWSSVFNAPTLAAFVGITVGCMPAAKGEQCVIQCILCTAGVTLPVCLERSWCGT